MRRERFLDFVQRLAAEVRRLEELVFRALDQVADVVDRFGLQAVRGTDREFEVVDRTGEDRIERRGRATSSGLTATGSVWIAPKTESWSWRMRTDSRIASSGPTAPFVSIVISSLSRSVRCATRAAETA